MLYYALAIGGGALGAFGAVLCWMWWQPKAAPNMPLSRKALALLAVLLLSVPSAIGVQHALAPTRGEAAGWLAAAGFELVYLSTAILSLSPELRTYAQRVALSAVATAIVLNTIADYSQRVPLGLANATQAWERFDALALVLSLVESLPLAGLAYAMATLLHRLSEADVQRLATDVQVQLELSQRDTQIGQLRGEAAQLASDLAQSQNDAAQLTTQIAQLQADAAQPDPIVAQQSTQIAQLQEQIAQADRAAAQQTREQTAELRKQDQEIAHLKELAAQPLEIDGIDLLAVARRLRSGGASLRESADLLRIPESTLRSRLDKAAQNGHLVEA